MILNIKQFHHYSLVFSMIASIPMHAYAQQLTVVYGKVSDATSGEPLPYVNIAAKNLPVGTISLDDGTYRLETKHTVDTILFTCVGYQPITIAITPFRTQEINIALHPEEILLDEVVVKPGENPAHILLRKVRLNRGRNDLSRFRSWYYEAYHKTRIDLTNPELLARRKALKGLDFIFNNIDTLQGSGKTYLPVLLSETVSDNYYRSRPKKELEVIKASRISGTKNESISQLTGKMYQNYSIYDNIVFLFETGWISPLAEFGQRYYRYYITDTILFHGHKAYRIDFEPRRKQERTFIGSIWVADTSWAICKYEMQSSEKANINYVENIALRREYAPLSDSLWFPVREDFYAEFTLTDKMTGFIGQKTSFFRKIAVDTILPQKLMNEPNDITLAEGNLERDETFWIANRPEKLTKKEAGIYAMIDSVQKIPLYRSLAGLIQMFYTYYYVRGPVEIGPYYRFYSFNPLEGNRLRFGGRTSNAFSTKLMLDGYLAYGTRDKQWKYGAGAMYLFDKNPRIATGISYKKDIEQLGQSQNAFLEDNFVTSLLRRKPNDKLTRTEELKLWFEREWFHGYSNTLTATHRTLYSTEFVPFSSYSDGFLHTVPSITTFELTLNTRFAWKEKYLMGEFERTSLGTNYPIINLNTTLGIPGISGSRYGYFKWNLNITQTLELAPIGYTEYMIDAGSIYGNVPFPLLEIHKGNETYAYDYMAFNLMNYYEFASNRYIGIFADHHFDGYFFNRIPLLREAKLREVVTFRALWGKLYNPENQSLVIPASMESVEKGYYEVGVGIENILKVFRIDAVWRLSYLNHQGIQPFGIRFGLQIIL